MSKRFEPAGKVDLLIFDMDGVLIDVSGSYRKAIQKTVEIYFNTCLRFEKKQGEWITKEEISLFKSAGGFNNDWDLTSGILLYLLAISGLPPLQRRKRGSSIEGAISHLKATSSRFSRKSPRPPKKDLASFLEKVKRTGGGLRGVRRALRTSWDGWVYRSGDLDQENLVKRIFQEIYLGKTFVSFYRMPRLFYKKKGLYLRERLLISRRILSTLSKKMRLGIASGRPRFEAELALKRFGILRYFDRVLTLDDCEQEEARIWKTKRKKVKLSKPHPYPILRAIEEIGIPDPNCGYVGDVVDDMKAARAAKRNLKILAVGFLGGRTHRRQARDSLIQAGADLIIEKPEDLLERFVMN